MSVFLVILLPMLGSAVGSLLPTHARNAGSMLAAIVALNSTPAAADDDWNDGNGDWNYRRHHHRGYYDNGNGDWNHHHRHRGYYDNGYGYSYYRERPRYYYEPPTYYYPPPAYYEPPPVYYYEPPPAYYYPQQPYYDPSFSFGLTVPIH